MDQSNQNNYLLSEQAFFSQIEQYFNDSSASFTEKAHAFARFMPRQSISYFLARNEIFKKIIPLHGSIFDFGIYRGSSFFTWLQLSSIYEPYNHVRKIVGFDSFKGFSALSDNDLSAEGLGFSLKAEGAMALHGEEDELEHGIALWDLNRPLGHVNKAQIINGTLPDTFAKYMQEHSETVIALANFGLGLYEPTRDILNLIKPRLQTGSILVFEDLNQAMWPGETKALFEVFGADAVSLERVPFCPHLSWMRVGKRSNES